MSTDVPALGNGGAGRKYPRPRLPNGHSKSGKRSVGDQFVPHTLTMLSSPAWPQLSVTAHRQLSRMEVEYMKHAGTKTSVPVTYGDFKAYGCVDRGADLAAAIRELSAFGFIEVTAEGRASANKRFQEPGEYRLTYVTKHRTNEWKSIETTKEAEEIARAARADTRKPPGKPVHLPTLTDSDGTRFFAGNEGWRFVIDADGRRYVIGADNIPRPRVAK